MERQEVFDNVGELIYVCDIHSYELLYMNEACQKFIGQTSESYKYKKCYSLLQGLGEPCPFCVNDKLSYDTVHVWEWNNSHLNRVFSLRDKLIQWEGREARFEIALDITDLKMQMLETEAKMSSIIQSIPGGICQIADDAAFTILWHNDLFLTLIGYTKEQLFSELGNCAKYTHPEDIAKMIAMMTEAKRSGGAHSGEMRIIRRNGEILTLMTTFNYVHNEGEVPVFYSVGVDISDYQRQRDQHKKELQVALAAARQASQAKSRFLSRMSHEMRTPLNAVIGMTTIAGYSQNDKKMLRNCHSKIESAAKYLLSLINDVLDVSRIESGHLLISEQGFSLPDFLYDLIDVFSVEAERKGVAFTIDVDFFPETRFRGDVLHLKQIFVNLLGNAIKFTAPGGQVNLRIRKLEREGDTVRFDFCVSDSGIGMRSEFLERIFNIFEQDMGDATIRHGGSGLGLSICKYLVEMMRGSIEVWSKEGEGSRFSVVLPLTVDAEGKTAAAARGLAPMRLLVADTVADSAAALLCLESLGLQAQVFNLEAVEAGTSGVESLQQMLLTAARRGQPYDLLLLSEDFPESERLLTELDKSGLCRSGPERKASRQMEKTRGLQIALTGVHHLLLEQRARDLGVEVLVRKPFFTSTLLCALQDIFLERGDETELAKKGRDFSGRRILLVEDNELNMEISYELLRMCGFEIEAARDGKEALEHFRSRPAGYFDVILMDILMPVMDGFAATRAIRALGRPDASTVPIVALSANIFEEDKKKSHESGMNAHLAKPVDIDTLCDLLERVMPAPQTALQSSVK